MTSENAMNDVRHRPDEPNWLNGYIGNYKSNRPRVSYIAKSTDSNAIQQSDYLKELFMDIVNDGLETAYENWHDHPISPSNSGVATSSAPGHLDADVIIVGAGITGLATAYELIRAGVSVKILEHSKRIGGRIFTYKDGDLAPGLYGEGNLCTKIVISPEQTFRLSCSKVG